MNTEAEKKVPFKDKIIPWYFVMFFAVIFSVNAVMFYLAKTSHRGVVDHQAYQRGLAYNKIIERGETQRALGWQPKVTFDDVTHQVSVNLMDKDGADITGAEIYAYAFRPTQDGHDFKALLPADTVKANQYQAKLDFPLKGLWELRFDIEKGDDVFYISKKITVK